MGSYFFAPALRAAQYFFILRLTALRAAGDILLRFRFRVPAAAFPRLACPRIESARLPATAAIAARMPLSSRWPFSTKRSAAASASLNVFNTFDFAINASNIRNCHKELSRRYKSRNVTRGSQQVKYLAGMANLAYGVPAAAGGGAGGCARAMTGSKRLHMIFFVDPNY